MHEIACPNVLPTSHDVAIFLLWSKDVSPWKNPKTDQWEDTFSVFTTDPNPNMQPIHDRQPVVL